MFLTKIKLHAVIYRQKLHYWYFPHFKNIYYFKVMNSLWLSIKNSLFAPLFLELTKEFWKSIENKILENIVLNENIFFLPYQLASFWNSHEKQVMFFRILTTVQLPSCQNEKKKKNLLKYLSKFPNFFFKSWSNFLFCFVFLISNSEIGHIF